MLEYAPMVMLPLARPVSAEDSCSIAVSAFINARIAGIMEPEDGVSYVALGLGKTIMDGFKSLRFSPKYPHNLHQLSSVKDFLSNSQREFMQYDFRKGGVLAALKENGVALKDLSAVVGRGGLIHPLVGGTYTVNDKMVYDLEHGVSGDHSCNLGGLIAREIADMAGDGVDLTSEKQIKAWIRKHPEALGNPNAALPETFRRETPKTGRNELCPCGSGKKYKKCCGAK